jgi:N-dimethylarginine dimethylaminohydrolase
LKIHSFNEWDSLRSVVVGSALHANWPSSDPVFALEKQKTTWHETPVPAGPVPQWIIDETEEDLDCLCKTLISLGAEVTRPREMDFVSLGGMYNYCPRDRLIIAGESVIDPAMMYPCRDIEIKALDFVCDDAPVIHMLRDHGFVLDAANICRMNDDWLYLESASGNRAAYEWLCQILPDIRIEICNFYSGVHIDSTVIPLREGLVMLNASRVTPSNCPKIFEKWDKIWIDDVIAQDFYQYPYASKWIALNCLSVDPGTIIVDATQTQIITLLEKRGFTVIPQQLRHSRTLGGGFHCVTLDLWREHD